MKATLPRFGAAVLAISMVAATGRHLTASTPFHFGLAKSMPADQATVPHTTEVKLWFTEPPSEETVSIRLIDASGDLVPTTDPAQDPEDGKAFSVAIPDGLTVGNYQVAWRGMGDDGHVVRGEFVFTVAGH